MRCEDRQRLGGVLLHLRADFCRSQLVHQHAVEVRDRHQRQRAGFDQSAPLLLRIKPGEQEARDPQGEHRVLVVIVVECFQLLGCRVVVRDPFLVVRVLRQHLTHGVLQAVGLLLRAVHVVFGFDEVVPPDQHAVEPLGLEHKFTHVGLRDREQPLDVEHEVPADNRPVALDCFLEQQIDAARVRHRGAALLELLPQLADEAHTSRPCPSAERSIRRYMEVGQRQLSLALGLGQPPRLKRVLTQYAVSFKVEADVFLVIPDHQYPL